VEATVPLAPGPADGKRFSFGTTSVVCAGLTILLPVLVVVFAGVRANQDTNDSTHFWGAFVVLVVGGVFAVLAAGVTSVLGTVAGAIALGRGERNGWLATVGLCVNAPVALFVLYLVVVVRANTGG
jgi:hypothetical protein